MDMPVIPAQAGIQMNKKSPANAGQHRYCARFAGYLNLLDSGLRRNDG
jgi:hypothetical protein